MPADFRVEGVPRVPLYASSSFERRVAVAPEGATLRGELELVGGECWLCIDLAEDHPLRVPGQRESCWVHAGERCSAPPLSWAGAKRARSVGAMLDLQWERPFARTGEVTYCVRMQPREAVPGHWDEVWRGELGEEFGSQRVEVTLQWPYPIGAARLCIDAALGGLEVTSAATAVSCPPEHLPAKALGPGAAVLTTAMGGAAPQLGGVRVEGRTDMLRRARPYEPRGTILGPRHVVLRSRPDPGSPRGPFRRALVMGLYHSCTSAMALELQRRFGIAVANRLVTNSRDALWKHRVHRERFGALDGATLAVLMVKEPRFWLQSVARNFYELHPVVRDERGGLQDATSRAFADLFAEVEHDTVVYPDALALWNDAVRSYFDEEAYPASACVVVRSEDFLFRFDEVMSEIAEIWGLGQPDAVRDMPSTEPREKAMKSGARSRAEARAYYADPANRSRGFTDEQLSQVSTGVDSEVTAVLDYGEGAVEAWAA